MVVLMGLGARAAIAARPPRAGLGASTPAAVLLGAGTPRARAWTGSLGALGRRGPGGARDAPGTIVVGDVVTLAAAGRAEQLEGVALHSHR